MEDPTPWLKVKMHDETSLTIASLADILGKETGGSEELPQLHLFNETAIESSIKESKNMDMFRLFRLYMSKLSLNPHNYAFFSIFANGEIPSISEFHPRYHEKSKHFFEHLPGTRQYGIMKGPGNFLQAYERVSWTKYVNDFCSTYNLSPKEKDYSNAIHAASIPVKFPTLEINGKTIQGRVCSDAVWGMHHSDPDVIVCPADGLHDVSGELGRSKSMVLTNDASKWFTSAVAYTGYERSGFFQSGKLYNSPAKLAKKYGVILEN